MAHVILVKCGDLYFKLKAHSYHYIRICTFPAITNTTLDTTPNVIQKEKKINNCAICVTDRVYLGPSS